MTRAGGGEPAAEPGEPLPGGMANSGAVHRDGAAVDRPAPPVAPALHAQLRALRAAGFGGAPLPLAAPVNGRERLTYLPGDVPLPPFPAWAMTDEALRSVGVLLRGLHDASAGLPRPADAPWSRELSDPRGGPVLCHNDVCPENVVFRAGRAHALIDFDLAAPGRRVWDVAMTARYWAPLTGETSWQHPAGLDPLARVRILADAYGLEPAARAEFAHVSREVAASCRAFVAARVARGDETYARGLADGGGWARFDRAEQWLRDAAHDITRALTAR
ncbi:Phosphotransferase enzyme family protein [Streptomyces sp. LcepLS]|nr:Phosphotransferase enzyme family protein [Streptomyces sp. TverLS-915]SCF49886.1 Phosphotransferase enzyme family protein [Streptomyces sp. LcepLS]